MRVPTRSTAPAKPRPTASAASRGLTPAASATTSPGKVAVPAAWVKKARRLSTIQAPSRPPATRQQAELEQRRAKHGQLEQVQR